MFGTISFGRLSVALVVLTAGLGGCSSAPRTTLLGPSDIELNTVQVAEQLASSDFVLNRPADAPPVVLHPEPMENLSDNRLSSADQWAAMSRVLFDPRVIELLRAHNVRVQLPRLKCDDLARAGVEASVETEAERPTHVFRSRLTSMTRAGADSGEEVTSSSARRKDWFTFEYTIVDLQTRQIVWNGSTELARSAHGSFID